ncbi:MAG TPA: hypothetical protein VJR27_01595 [Candidatus Saccharimonadales bacterium]|nr:hypothetical protein [Candidatus Saccharimonadales bacterium]
MHTLSQIEVNIALLPEYRLADQLTKASHGIASRYPALVRLGSAGLKLSLAPHLTLYQGAFPFKNIPKLDSRLTEIAKHEQPHALTSTGLAYNQQEGSIEDRKEVTDALVTLQENLITKVNSLREGRLMERDPAGNVLHGLLQAPGRLGENIQATGYGEVGDPRTGGLFRPHDTLAWLEPGIQVDLAYEQSLLNPRDMSGTYPAIGLFALGPQGTCPQLLAQYSF